MRSLRSLDNPLPLSPYFPVSRISEDMSQLFGIDGVEGRSSDTHHRTTGAGARMQGIPLNPPGAYHAHRVPALRFSGEVTLLTDIATRGCWSP